METPERKKCCCPCHKMGGVLIALLGVVVLLGALDVLSSKTVWITSAILVIFIGLKQATSNMCKCCDAA